MSKTIWYVGALNNNEARTVTLDLSFLNPSYTYSATLIVDGINSDILPRDFKIVSQQVNSKLNLDIKLAKGGGAYLKFSKL